MNKILKLIPAICLPLLLSLLITACDNPDCAHDYTLVNSTATCTTDGVSEFACAKCGEHRSEVAAATGHEEEPSDTQAATCEQDGWVEYTCLRCDETRREVESAPGHDLRIVQDKSATCTQDGVKLTICNRCDYQEEQQTEAVGHAYFVREQVEASCTTAGMCVQMCSQCEDQYSETLDALGHDYVMIESIEATCTSAGAAYYACSRCSDGYSTSEEPLGHDYQVIINVEATCTGAGTYVEYCLRCQDKVYENTDALGHDYVISAETAATCTENGIRSYQCSRCSDHDSETLDALGHDFQVASDVSATCLEGGTIVRECSRCDEMTVEDVDPLGHDHQIVEDHPATCTAEGYAVYACTRCNDSYEKKMADALGHDHRVIESVAATCTNAGEAYYQCSRCTDSYNTKEEPLGHDYQVIINVEATCTGSGVYVENCSRCQDTIREDYEALGHDWKWISQSPATCIMIGKEEYTCTRCAKTDIRVIPMLEHDYTETKVVSQTCMSNGERVLTCSLCQGNKIETLIAWGHKHQVDETIPATCAEQGRTVYTCQNDGCEDSYISFIPKVAHTPGEKATIHNACICTVCRATLQPQLAYDLAINYYYGFADEFNSVMVNSQNQTPYDLGEQTYYATADHLSPLPFHSGMTLQNFYTHQLLTTKEATTADGKRYTLDAGFKVAFHYNFLNEDISELSIVKNTDFLSLFDDPELLKIVQKNAASNPYYELYQIVDFSDSYIEIAKQVNGKYTTIGKIDATEWASVLTPEDILLSDKNGALFFESGTYRILFKFSTVWVVEAVSGRIYDVQGQLCYPYGFANDQYDYFYVTVADETQNVLLPDDLDETRDMFYQLYFKDTKVQRPFVGSGDLLDVGEQLNLVVDSKIGHWDEGAFYEGRTLTEWTLTLGIYDEKNDAYTVNYSFDLLERMENDSITAIILPKNYLTKGHCKITVSYTFYDENSQTESETTDAYYLLIADIIEDDIGSEAGLI